MDGSVKSSIFTIDGAEALGPPLIGALLRMPWEAVRRRMDKAQFLRRII